MQQADTQFKNGNYSKAIQLYNGLINAQTLSQQQMGMIILNLSSAYYSSCEYQKCMQTSTKYMSLCKQTKKQPKVQSYLLYCRCLIKLKKLLSHQQHIKISQAQTIFPYHKVLLQSIKTIKQLQITQNQDQYLDKIFTKLLQHPQFRNYLTQQSFLTKVQKIIRNPSLASALIKTDKRLQNVTEIILMAEEDQDNNKK